MKRHFIAELALFALTIATLYSFVAVTSSCIAEQSKQRIENPIQSAKSSCMSKRSGSRPSCWTEGDWLVYCQRVQCKVQKGSAE